MIECILATSFTCLSSRNQTKIGMACSLQHKYTQLARLKLGIQASLLCSMIETNQNMKSKLLFYYGKQYKNLYSFFQTKSFLSSKGYLKVFKSITSSRVISLLDASTFKSRKSRIPHPG